MQLLLLGLAGLFLYMSLSWQRTYRALPLKELKRRARAGDEVAGVLYRAAAYGTSLQLILWILVGLSASLLFVLIAETTAAWLAVLACAGIIWLSFVRGSDRSVGSISVTLTRFGNPLLAWLAGHLHPLTERAISMIRRHRPVTFHTGLYDRDDLLELIDRQLVQADNRIDEWELLIARGALTFGDKPVREYLIPRRVVKTISVNDAIGPVLMDELHASGFSRVPVYETNPDNLVGVLFMRDTVGIKAGGMVKDHMKPGICYLHEEDSLAEALQAMLKTRQHLFVVVNSFEEYVGIITIEDVLEQIVGTPIVDEFDKYEDMRAVAARHAAKDHAAHQEKAPESPTEVVE